jgi:hypothetical protein
MGGAASAGDVRDGPDAPRRGAMRGAATGRPRGSVGLYAAAFVLVVASAAALAAAALGLLASVGLLWISIGLSALAFLAAVASVAVRR